MMAAMNAPMVTMRTLRMVMAITMMLTTYVRTYVCSYVRTYSGDCDYSGVAIGCVSLCMYVYTYV